MEILKLLKQDHEQIITLIHSIVDTSERPNTDGIKDYFVHLKDTLYFHLHREDKEVYGYLETLPSAADEIIKARKDHDDIDFLLTELTTILPGQSAWGETIHEIKSKIEKHIAHEERVLFPLFQKLKENPMNAANTNKVQDYGHQNITPHISERA